MAWVNERSDRHAPAGLNPVERPVTESAPAFNPCAWLRNSMSFAVAKRGRRPRLVVKRRSSSFGNMSTAR